MTKIPKNRSLAVSTGSLPFKYLCDFRARARGLQMGFGKTCNDWQEIWYGIIFGLLHSRIQVCLDTHGHQAGAGHAAHGPELNAQPAVDKVTSESHSDVEAAHSVSTPIDHDLLTQVVGVAILEFGVVLHR